MSRIRYGRWLIVLFLAVVCLSPTAALASNKGAEVPCRVEPNGIKISLTTDGSVAYGVVEVGTTEDTVALGDTQTVQNTSKPDQTVDFNIKSGNATDGTDWTLAATTGADAFTHTASIDGGTNWDIAMILADNYVTLATGVMAAGTVDFDLQIGMPTSITDYVEKTITVTILATAP